jgi:hypothetical protein
MQDGSWHSCKRSTATWLRGRDKVTANIDKSMNISLSVKGRGRCMPLPHSWAMQFISPHCFNKISSPAQYQQMLRNTWF